MRAKFISHKLIARFIVTSKIQLMHDTDAKSGWCVAAFFNGQEVVTRATTTDSEAFLSRTSV